MFHYSVAWVGAIEKIKGIWSNELVGGGRIQTHNLAIMGRIYDHRS